MQIKLPHLFKPREYQRPFLKAMVSPKNLDGKKRAVLLDHRRTGKDKLAFNYMVMNAMHRVGVYYYFFPTYQQGRKILWDGIDKDGFKFLDHVPPNLIANKNQTEMKLTLANGSIIQIVGSDNIDSVVGTNPVGCVFSEYALQDPKGWDYVRPILRENGGWSVFPYTPRGKNHGHDLFEMAKDNPEWYVERLTVLDTYGKGGTIGPKEIDQERLDGMNENLVQQEFYCSFDAAIQYAVFGDQMLKAREEGRITTVPYQKGMPVDTWWDLGRDTTAIWFTQALRNEVRVIDYHDAIQSTLDKEWEVLQNRKYVYGIHHFPHDGDYKDYKTGKTPKEIASDLGFEVEIVPRISKDSQISAARMLFNRCWFDEKKCGRGLDALSSWHYEWDDATRAMSKTPIHDWSCFTGNTEVLTRNGKHQIMTLSDGEVLTPCGFKPFKRLGITGINAPLVEVEFTDGLSVKCTPEHLFLTESGWKSAESLTPNTRIQSSLTRSRSISMEVYTVFGRVKNTIPEAVKNFIGMRGKSHSEKFQKDATYTTKMAFMQIIRLRTLSVFPVQNTFAFQYMPLTDIVGSRKMPVKKPLFGINQKKDSFGIADMQKMSKHGQNGNTLIKFALNVASLFLGLIEKVGIRKNGVPAFAESLTIKQVKKLNERSDVWCIEVPDGECFSLSNGAIVHNSHAGDAFCQLAVSHEDEVEWTPKDRYSKRPKHNRSWMTA